MRPAVATDSGEELVRAVAGGHFLGVAADAVVGAFAGEDAGATGFDAGGAGGGLLGGVEVEEVGALAAAGEGLLRVAEERRREVS